MSIFDDIYAQANARVNEILTPSSYPMDENAPNQPNVGGLIFDAIYQFGRGKIDMARERVATAFLKSKEGMKITQEVEKQRAAQWTPWIIGGVILILAMGYIAGRR